MVWTAFEIQIQNRVVSSFSMNSWSRLPPVLAGNKTEESDSPSTSTTVAALLFFAAQFPHRQFNSAELSILSGIGRTALSQIKNAEDTPFSIGKCTLRRLDEWLARHPGHKQE